LLHGFPEFWYGWRHQIGPLAEAGYRVIVPDQRGYGSSDKPEAVASYALDTLADDVAGLIEATGEPRAAVVGHDWGGIAAWWTAVRHPDRVDRLVAINAPHPIVFQHFLRTSPRQLLKSWYTFYFQLPWLPETLFRRKNWQSLAESLRSTSRPGTFSDAALDHYREAWSQPGAMRSMIHWYRAAFRYPPTLPNPGRIHLPTRLIWGPNDRFIDRRVAEPSIRMCDQGVLEFIEGATHWVHLEEPEQVNRLLLDFLQSRVRPPAP
jgi:pimeloyl-ACP methyl ester carboxylesterase